MLEEFYDVTTAICGSLELSQFLSKANVFRVFFILQLVLI